MVKDLNKKISQIAYNCLNLHRRCEARLHSAKRHKGYLPSLARALPEKVMEMTCGLLPKGFDVDKELEQMWEERALNDLFLLNYGLQGLNALLLKGNFVDERNYYEDFVNYYPWWNTDPVWK